MSSKNKKRYQVPDIQERNQTSEVKENLSNLVSTSEVEVDTLTLDEYLAKVKVHPGLVASFKFEAKRTGSGLEPKTMEDWKRAFEAQSNRIYK